MLIRALSDTVPIVSIIGVCNNFYSFFIVSTDMKKIISTEMSEEFLHNCQRNFYLVQNLYKQNFIDYRKKFLSLPQLHIH